MGRGDMCTLRSIVEKREFDVRNRLMQDLPRHWEVDAAHIRFFHAQLSFLKKPNRDSRQNMEAMQRQWKQVRGWLAREVIHSGVYTTGHDAWFQWAGRTTRSLKDLNDSMQIPQVVHGGNGVPKPRHLR